MLSKGIAVAEAEQPPVRDAPTRLQLLAHSEDLVAVRDEPKSDEFGAAPMQRQREEDGRLPEPDATAQELPRCRAPAGRADR